MTIMGHSSGGDMNRIYDTIEDSDLIEAIDKIETFLQSTDQSTDQEAKIED